MLNINQMLEDGWKPIYTPELDIDYWQRDLLGKHAYLVYSPSEGVLILNISTISYGLRTADPIHDLAVTAVDWEVAPEFDPHDLNQFFPVLSAFLLETQLKKRWLGTPVIPTWRGLFWSELSPLVRLSTFKPWRH